MKITRIAVRLVQVLAGLTFCFFIALIDITGNPYNLGAAAIFMFIVAIIEFILFKRDRAKEQQESVCTS